MDDGLDLFRYTSGRWIYNESLRLKERILHFNVVELKKAAAAAVNKDAAKVQSFRKLAEGGFNRAFELTIDGLQVIARLPYPSTYPKHFSVASEVATMNLVRSYGVPVPKVLDYSDTSNNAVGAEYMIMEKVHGRDLGDVWYELSEKERMKVVVQVARVEPVLFSIALPACGSVYYKRDLGIGTETVDIAVGKGAGEDAGGSAGQLCIGPDVAQKWWYDKRSQLSVPRGPFLQADQAFTVGAAKELVWLKTHARPRLPYIIPHRELHGYQKVSPADHVASVEKYLQIAPHLVPADEDYLLRPTLRHPDFQPRNIFVTDDFTITGIIDWQHCSVLPLILQAGVPEYFQNFGDDESLRLKKPSLPKSFNHMNDADQAQALEQHRRRQLHYYYFVATYKYNKPHFDALCLDSTMPKQKLQQYASTPWDGDNISLKAELIRAVKNWPVLTASKSGNVPVCPIYFSDEEVEQCLRIEAEQNDIDVQMEKIRDRIGIGTDGWTSNERYEDACEENEHVKAEALDGEDDATRNEILENWPFDDHEEY
ncbi:phosphotransferase enzyme family protein [Rhexocercosporidium sp. MPI-PUGE-AT-0058]|nr:phosphotransferase enzyme family protein [Rhexocercosporidium sp. MPI-PUGE-AT-0058]